DPRPAPPPPPPPPSWEEEFPESEVSHLTDENFDEFISSNPSVLVMFYAPWCGHCKAMKPDYMDAAVAIKDKSVDGAMAAVDCTKNPQVAKKFDVSGYLTLKYFK